MVQAAQLLRQNKTALICMQPVLSVYIQLVLNRKFFTRLGLVCYNEALVTRLGSPTGIISALDSEYLLV